MPETQFLSIMENQMEITKQENIVNKKTNLLSMQIKRTPEGTRLFLQSGIFETFFSTNESLGTLFTDGEGKSRELYKMPNINSSSDNRKMHYQLRDNSTNSLVSAEGYVQMSFLRTKGIDEGVIFKIDNLTSKQAMSKFVEEFKFNAIQLYKEFVKPESQHLSIQIKEGED